jgi:hypothetical protein
MKRQAPDDLGVKGAACIQLEMVGKDDARGAIVGKPRRGGAGQPERVLPAFCTTDAVTALHTALPVPVLTEAAIA